MNDNLVGLAFGAGLVAALNPCGFAMLPGYLTLVVRGRSGSGTVGAVGRAVLATLAMTAGFVAVFGGFAALTVAAAGALQRYLPYVTVLIGVALVALVGLGCWLLAGRRLGLLMPDMVAHNTRWAPTARIGSMFGYGVGYALASLSCTVGPFLAVTGAGLRSGGAWPGVAVFAAYAAGFALIVGVLAVAGAFATAVLVDRLRRIVPYVNKIGGVLLIVVGAYVGYYGLYEVRLFTPGGNPQDPVIAAAGRIQGALAGWVHQHGAWPWVLAVAVSGVIGLLVWALLSVAARLRRGRPATAGDAP
ncbi:cytochrome c biogenesis CcdA family protein [Mycobacterium sp. NPDC003449]